MHRAAGELDSGGERLALRVQTGKRRQQRGMNVDHAVPPGRDEAVVEQAHEAGERDEADAGVAQRPAGGGGEGRPVGFGDDQMRDAGRFSAGQPRGVGPVADDDGDLGGIAGVGGGIDQRLRLSRAWKSAR